MLDNLNAASNSVSSGFFEEPLHTPDLKFQKNSPEAKANKVVYKALYRMSSIEDSPKEGPKKTDRTIICKSSKASGTKLSLATSEESVKFRKEEAKKKAKKPMSKMERLALLRLKKEALAPKKVASKNL